MQTPLGPAIARSLLSVTESYASMDLAVTDRSLGEINLLAVAGNYGVLERLADRRGERSPERVAVWLAGATRITPVDEAMDRLWDNLSEQERDRNLALSHLRDVASQSG